MYRNVKEGRYAPLGFVLGLPFKVVLHRHWMPHVFEGTHRVDGFLRLVTSSVRSDDAHRALWRFCQVLVVLQRLALLFSPLGVRQLDRFG